MTGWLDGSPGFNRLTYTHYNMQSEVTHYSPLTVVLGAAGEGGWGGIMRGFYLFMDRRGSEREARETGREGERAEGRGERRRGRREGERKRRSVIFRLTPVIHFARLNYTHTHRDLEAGQND